MLHGWLARVVSVLIARSWHRRRKDVTTFDSDMRVKLCAFWKDEQEEEESIQVDIMEMW